MARLGRKAVWRVDMSQVLTSVPALQKQQVHSDFQGQRDTPHTRVELHLIPGQSPLSLVKVLVSMKPRVLGLWAWHHQRRPRRACRPRRTKGEALQQAARTQLPQGEGTRHGVWAIKDGWQLTCWSERVPSRGSGRGARNSQPPGLGQPGKDQVQRRLLGDRQGRPAKVGYAHIPQAMAGNTSPGSAAG